MAKWCVKRDDDGSVLEAGFHIKPGEVAADDRYDEPQKDIDDVIVAKRRAKKDAEFDLDVSGETDAVKAIYAYVKSKHGRL